MKFDQFTNIQNLEDEISDSIYAVNQFLLSDLKLSKFILIPRLNVLFRADANISLFLDVTKEYRSHTNINRRLLAIFYIGIIAVLLKFRVANYFFKVISLEVSEFYPVILGGNNRLRIIDSANSNALLVSKNTGNEFFTKNAIKAFQQGEFLSLGAIPEVLAINNTLYFERQIKGLAINRRVMCSDETDIVTNQISNFFSVQETLSRNISIRAFMRYKTAILIHFANISKSDKTSNLVELFISVGRQVEHHLGNISIIICPSHGDLNRGNVFLDKKDVHIIDWEYYMYRCIDYDRVIYDNELRHIVLSDYLEFFKKSDLFDFSALIFLLEELSFRILNFKSDVSDSQLFIDTITMLIKQEILKGNLNDK